MCNFPSSNLPKVWLGFLRRYVAEMGPSAAARTDLGSIRLGNCTFGKLPLGKLPLGRIEKMNLGKYLTSISTYILT